MQLALEPLAVARHTETKDPEPKAREYVALFREAEPLNVGVGRLPAA